MIDKDVPGAAKPTPALAAELTGPLQHLEATAAALASLPDPLDTSEARQVVTALHQQAAELQATIENLLWDALVKRGRLQLSPEVVPLLDLLDEVGRQVRPVVVRRQQQLRLDRQAARQSLWGDRRRLGQALVNLIQQASRRSAADAAITVNVSAATKGGAKHVEVGADGPPVSPEEIAAFYTAHLSGGTLPPIEPLSASSQGATHAPSVDSPASTPVDAGLTDPDEISVATAISPGALLALRVTAEIVGAHSGRCGAENQPSGGASFWFELPAPPTRARPARPPNGPNG